MGATIGKLPEEMDIDFWSLWQIRPREVYDRLLLDKTYFNNNQTHRHAVGYGTEKRISLTFRMMQ